MTEWTTAAPSSHEAYAERMTGEHLDAGLVIERDDMVIGDLMLLITDAWSQAEVADRAKGVQAEIGWTVGLGHQGRGYATEAVEALLGVCFDGLGLRRVVANCFADNTASWRLMERLGMRREAHTVAQSLHRSHNWLDGYGYALLAEEWRARPTGVPRVAGAGGQRVSLGTGCTHDAGEPAAARQEPNGNHHGDDRARIR